MRLKILLLSCVIFYSAFCGSVQAESPGLAFALSSEKDSYYEEEEIVLKLVIENVSTEEKQIELRYLQPVENKHLYVAEEPFRLDVEFNGSPVERFTNHMPPEPKPCILPTFMSTSP